MEQEGVYSHRIKVAKPHIDVNGHVNNVVYVQWMQDVAYACSAAGGYDGARLEELDSTWIIRSHLINYRRPALEGDTLLVFTWLTSVRNVSVRRRYKFLRESDGVEIANGESDWVYLDRSTGKPKAIEEEMKAAFPVVAPADEP